MPNDKCCDNCKHSQPSKEVGEDWVLLCCNNQSPQFLQPVHEGDDCLCFEEG